MLDPRVTRLAELLCTHSTQLGPSDTVLVHASDIPDNVVAEVVRVARSKGAKVVVRVEREIIRRELMMGMTEENAATIAKIEGFEMDEMTAYISLRGSNNFSTMKDVPDSVLGMWSKVYSTPVVFQKRVPNTKWVGLRWPSDSMSQQASMSTHSFENFYFDVCTMDYDRMHKASLPLEELMGNADIVQLKGPGTDMTFSIKDCGAKACFGRRNIPDGECFSAPVKDSMNGVVQYNTASLYQGNVFENIRFEVKNGRIVDASAGALTAKVNEILDTDEGARYFGEWAIGFNPYVLTPMLDTLFDEKIAGSFHLTPGNSYDKPGGNGNKSSIHWDIVCIQRPEYGGGEIWIDGRLIRKDGLFVVPELEGLNPENLK